MILPATWKWKEAILKPTTGVNAVFGLKEVPPSNLSKIRKVNFPHNDAKKPGDNFACSSNCDRYHSLRRGATVGSQQALKWAKN